MPPLQIAHVLLSQGFAGSERSTAESCNAQCAQGHDVRLILRRSHRSSGGVSIVDHLDPRVRVLHVPDRLFTGWRLRAMLRQDPPQVVHAHLRRATRLVAPLSGRMATVSTLHIGVNGPHFAHMGGLVCNARWQLDRLPPGYTGLVHKAHNSLVPHREVPPEERLALRKTLGIGPTDFLIGGVGRLHPAKGWETLIAAARQLPKAPSWRLVLFGAGPLEPDLRRQAEGEPRILFAGFQSQVKDWYPVFDVFVCPSRFEPLPRVILEAMDAGTPVIASDADGCRELIEDHGGDLFPVGDVPALANLLRTHLGRPRQRHRPDLSAHHVHHANAAMVDFYRRVLAHRGSPP